MFRLYIYINIYMIGLKCLCATGYLDLVQRLEFGVDHLQKNAVYQIE